MTEAPPKSPSPVLAEAGRTTLVSALLLFTVIGAFVVLKSARDALFLGAFSSSLLPYFLVINALASAITATAYVRLAAASSTGRAMRVSLAAFSGGTLLFWAAIEHASNPSILLLYVWVGLFGTLVPVQAWSLISERLLIRRARRTLGIIGAGASLGGSAGGLLAKACAKAWGAPALLPIAAVLILLALAVTVPFSRQGSRAPAPAEHTPPPRLDRRFAAFFLVLVAIGSLVSTFVDFQFKTIAQRELTTAAELAALFGSFYAYVEVATLLFQILATPLLLRTLTVSATLCLLPVTLFAGNGFLVASGSLWSVLFLRGSEQILKQSVDRSSRELLYLPVPSPAKIRLRSIVETLGVRLPEAGAALLLVLLVSIGNVPLYLLAVLNLLMLSVWTVSALLLGREYPQELKHAILHREIDASEARSAVFSSDFYRLLPELLRTSGPDTILHLLELLAATGDRTLGPRLRPFLDYPDARVRHAALDLLITQREDLSSDVERCLWDDDLAVRIEAVHYLCMRCAPRAMEELDAFLLHPDLRVQAAAVACALNEPGERTRETAHRRLDAMLTQALEQGAAGVRLEIAHILEQAGSGASHESLFRRLLSDPAPEVRRAALRGIARARPPALLADLLDALRDRSLRSEAREALRGYGEALLPQLRAALQDEQAPLDQRKQLLRILGEIGGPEAVELLLATTRHPELALRFAAIKGLSRLRKRTSLEAFRPALESLLEREVRALETEAQRARSFSPRRQSVMERVLRQRQQWARERVFRVLGLLYEPDGIYDAYLALRGGDRRHQDLALEFLDAILGSEHRRRVLPLVEPRRETMSGVPDRDERAAVLFRYLRERDPVPAAAAMADLSPEEVGLWKPEIQRCVEASGGLPLVEETLRSWYGEGRMHGGVPSPDRPPLTTVQKIEHLSKVDIFSRLGAHELLLLAEQSVEIEFEPDQVIFEEGAAAERIFSVVTGRVELSRRAGHLEVVRPGESFGTLAALAGEARFFTARALEHCLCLQLPGDRFWEILEAYPAVARGVIEVLVHRIETLTDRLRGVGDAAR